MDGTIGGGGHAEAILRRLGKDAQLIGFDRDVEALAATERRLGVYNGQFRLVHDSYANFDAHLGADAKGAIDFMLLDLGLSSRQLAGGRGFSHQSENDPLDLRFDDTHGESLAQRLRHVDPQSLTKILAEYGEINKPQRVARAIFDSRKQLNTVADLLAVLQPVTPRQHARQFLSQVWQALRIWVNDELRQVQIVLPKIVDWLRPGGVMAVISFQSLEDRMVKQFLAQQENPCICPRELPRCVCGRTPTMKKVTRKAIKPSAEEIESNPRSRSARLRAAVRLSTS